MLGWLLACVPEPETERVEVRPGEELGDSAPEDADDTAAAAWPPFIEWTSPTEGEHVSEIVRVDIATSPASDRAIDEVTEMSLRVDGTEVVHRYNSGIEATIEACPEAEPYQLALAVVATTAGGATTERERTVTRDFETILDLSIARSRIEGPDREANARISTDETLVSVDWRLDGELVASDVPAQVDSSKCDPCTGACWDASATLDLRAYRSRVTVACTITTASGDQVIDEEMLEFNRDADYDGRDGR
ncbi:MAG: hypothetical protein FJ102_27115, partial [Deltaproteobacteria bacterium]|nr:hypothetical protein [Deltaproteobacteria bacterium]